MNPPSIFAIIFITQREYGFDRINNYPLTNLFVSMLQWLGIEVNEFSTGRATFQGLQMT